MDYSDTIWSIMNTVNINKDRIILGVIRTLEDNLVPTKDLWSLHFFNSKNFVIIGGNLDMAILEMDSYLKRNNKEGTINNWINEFADNFKHEIQDFIDIYDNDDDPNFEQRIKNTFTLTNIISIMYDKLKETITENDIAWLEPIIKTN